MALRLWSLRKDPLPFLVSTASQSLHYFVRRDLLGTDAGPADALWKDPRAARIVGKQRPDGRWAYPGGGRRDVRSIEDYDQMETYRQLGFLIEKFAFDRSHPAIRKAASFLFSHQTEEGDFRGIYGRQYTPNYSAGITELLIKAGYGGDPGIHSSLRWLTTMRQEDGGWAIPFRTARTSKTITEAMQMEPIPPDKSKPSSHLVTGMVLRAFAAARNRAYSEEAKRAGRLLASRFFTGDPYPDRKGPAYWWKVSFPFWFTDIVSSLDSLASLGFTPENHQVAEALKRLRARQLPDGSFDVTLLRTGEHDVGRWVSLAVCRVFKKLQLPD